MNSKIESLENKDVVLEITVEAEKFDNAITQAYFKNAKYFNVPGFRKGKVPQNVVERHYGKEVFYEDAFNAVFQESYEAAVKEHNLDVVSRPDVDVKQVEKGKDLIYTATVQTKPEVKLGKYKGIKIEKKEYTVTPEDIEAELNKMAEKNARLITVEDREAQAKDLVNIDFEGFVDGVAFEGGKAEGHDLEIGSNSFVPGFEDQVIGMKTNEEKDIKVKFPDEYFSKELSGKDATFKVKVNEIKVKELPTLDDEFAKDVSEFEKLEELKDSIKEKLEHENEHKAKHETEDEVLTKVIEASEVEVPSGMIELEVENMLKDLEQRIKYQGLDIENYLKMVGKTEDELKKDYEPQALNSIKTRLTIEAIGKAENIEADEESLNKELEEMATMYGKKAEELKTNEGMVNYLKQKIEFTKTIDFLVKNSKH